MSSTGHPVRGGEALRRYPALAWLAGAVALVLLLPSGLNVPNAGPSSLAEYAPVPGQGSGESPVAELGEASSAGLGAGPGSGSTSAAGAAEERGSSGRASSVRKPGTKRCVGDPPRQTEDPLSPPCVAFFDGDNFGATSTGVTRDEIRVVIEPQRVSSDRDPAAVVDCQATPSPADDYRDIICHAYMRYFNDRYQTYGRTVHLWSGRDLSTYWADMYERFTPFAVGRDGLTGHAAKSGVVNTSFISNPRRTYQDNAPFFISFRPDWEDIGTAVASYVCTRLHGRTARHAGDVSMHATTRRFGVWTSKNPPGGETARLLDALRESCGIDPVVVNGYSDANGVARMRSAGVTTVIVQEFLEAGIAAATSAATQAGWFPEWVIPGALSQRGLDSNYYARAAVPAQWANAFGITFDYRRDAAAEQPWYRAYREGCPACPDLTPTQAYPAAMTYEMLAMLFYGVQAAGPRLTPASLDKGMHAIPPNGSPDPYKPAAYFAPGNYSFVKDAMAIWWDPSGRSPGSTATGCYRLPDEGRRRRPGEWPVGDDVDQPGPCQGDIAPNT